MAASTITRGSWTDDDGSGTTGTIIQNSRLQADVYDKVDQLMSGAGSYTTLTLGGKLSVEGGQIVFPATQSASSNVNTLDDYEEGTWTPVIGGSGGTSGQTYSAQQGRYIKIGSYVWAAFRAVLSNKGTITTSVQIQGLPFTMETGTLSQYAGVLDWHALATNWVNLALIGNENTTTASVFGATAAGTSNLNTALAAADIGNTTQFTGMVAYRAAN